MLYIFEGSQVYLNRERYLYYHLPKERGKGILIVSVRLFLHACTRVYLFGILLGFKHCTGHIMTGSYVGRGNQYIQLVKVLYCKLPTNGKQLPAFPLKVRPGFELRSQMWK